MHGGARPGAGRPKTAPETVVLRVPVYQKLTLLAVRRVLSSAPDTESALLALRPILDRFIQGNPL
jgi:hypothetical protein